MLSTGFRCHGAFRWASPLFIAMALYLMYYYNIGLDLGKYAFHFFK